MTSVWTGLVRRVQTVATVRAIARTVPALRFLTGGIRRSSAWGAAHGAPVLLTFGVPRAMEADLDRALPEMAKLFVARRARSSLVLDEYHRAGSEAVLMWGGSTVPALQGLVAAVGSLPVISCFAGPVPLTVAGVEHRTIAVDWSGLYLNPRRPNDLEYILNHFDFEAHAALTTLAARLRAAAFPPPVGSDVTVILQDRSDPAMVFAPPGHPRPVELVARARSENPDARLNVVLKGRPDRRPLLTQGLPPRTEVVSEAEEPAVLARSERVYTVNSPLAVDSVLRGAEAVVFGSPFYAGLGLTRDSGQPVRRVRPVDRNALFAAVFGLYCRLLDSNGRLTTLAAIDDRLRRGKAA